jgi:hypothetical protein
VKKRFTDAEKWAVPKYRAMTPQAKLLWLWLNDNCDNAGVVTPDIDLAAFQIGEPINEGHIAELKERLKEISPGTYWIQGFIAFQFGKVPPPSADGKMAPLHRSIWNSLAAHNLTYSNPDNLPNQPLLDPSKTPPLQSKGKEGSKTPLSKGKGISNQGGVGGGRRSAAQDAAWKTKLLTDAVKSKWLVAFNEANPTPDGYQLTGADSGQLKLFLQNTTLTASQIIQVAIDAWKHKTQANFSHCRNLRSLAYLCNHFNEIKSEIYGNKNGSTNRPGAAANTLNATRAGQYSGVGKVG